MMWLSSKLLNTSYKYCENQSSRLQNIEHNANMMILKQENGGDGASYKSVSCRFCNCWKVEIGDVDRESAIKVPSTTFIFRNGKCMTKGALL